MAAAIPPAFAIELQGIHVRRGRRRPRTILQGLSLAVAPGEPYALLGVPGSGKTAALLVVAGLVRPDRGAVLVDGTPLGPRTPPRSTGALLQAASFGGRSCRGALLEIARAAGLADPKGEVDDALALVELGRRARRPFAGCGAGERRRVALAAALLGKPRLLLLDDPTAGLPDEDRRSFLKLLLAVLSGGSRAALYATPRFDEAVRFAHRVGILHEGRLVHEAPVAHRKGLEEVYLLRSRAEAAS